MLSVYKIFVNGFKGEKINKNEEFILTAISLPTMILIFILLSM